MRYPLTTEQQIAVEHFSSGENLKIEAFAGTGKTSTLCALAASATNRTGHYFAFNKAIADEAKTRFPSSVATSTVHSMAYRYVSQAYSYSSIKLSQSPTANQIAHLLQAQPKSQYRLFDRIDLSGREYASALYQACKNFLSSADPSPAIKHFQRVGKLKSASEAEMLEFSNRYLPNVQTIWCQMQDPASPLPLGHDGYLKLWALSRPRFAKDFILLDEAQDTSDVVLGLAGEEAVLESERRKLIECGRLDLAELILHVAKVEGDGAGYDIKSFSRDGKEKHIEVKTTRGDKESAFYMSACELRFAAGHADSYYIYRVFDFDPTTLSGKVFVHKGIVQENFTVSPIQFKVSPT